MKFHPQTINDVILIKPLLQEDNRGYFIETFRKDLFEEAIGYSVNFIQENESKSAKGILRGLHYQLPPFSQNKLVRVIQGSVLDVAVDIRKNSPTFGQHVTAELNEVNKHQLFVPKGFAHGFVVLSESAIFSYMVDNYYAPNYEKGIAFDDEKLAIDWILPSEDIELSERDKRFPNLSDTNHYL